MAQTTFSGSAGYLTVTGQTAQSLTYLQSLTTSTVYTGVVKVGAFYTGSNGKGGGDYYMLQRGFVAFDTSSIPDDATITSAKLRFTAFNAEYGTGRTTYIVPGTQLGSPCAGTDWPRVTFTSYGSFVDSITNNQTLDVTLNATGMSAINKTGVTKFALLGAVDFNKTLAGQASVDSSMGVEAMFTTSISLIIDYTGGTTTVAVNNVTQSQTLDQVTLSVSQGQAPINLQLNNIAHSQKLESFMVGIEESIAVPHSKYYRHAITRGRGITWL